MKWTVNFEQDPDSGDWGAHAADLPVFVGGDSREEVEHLVRDGISFHLAGLRADGYRSRSRARRRPPSTSRRRYRQRP